MSSKSTVNRVGKRSWSDTFRAFGRAHRKASSNLETSMPLLRHLEELRQRIFKAFFALVLTTGLSFVFASQIIDYLTQPLGGSQALVSIEVTENIAIFMRVALLSGIILAMPVILYQALSFVLPGLAAQRKALVTAGRTGSISAFSSRRSICLVCYVASCFAVFGQLFGDYHASTTAELFRFHYAHHVLAGFEF